MVFILAPAGTSKIEGWHPTNRRFYESPASASTLLASAASSGRASASLAESRELFEFLECLEPCRRTSAGGTTGSAGAGAGAAVAGAVEEEAKLFAWASKAWAALASGRKSCAWARSAPAVKASGENVCACAPSAFAASAVRGLTDRLLPDEESPELEDGEWRLLWLLEPPSCKKLCYAKRHVLVLVAMVEP